MSDYRKQIEEAIRAVVLRSPTSYWWFGKRGPQLSTKVNLLLPANTARNYLLFNLQLQLYSDFYCRGSASPSRPASAGVPSAGRTPFVEELSAANCGKGCWENGWAVHKIEGDELVVQKRGLSVCVRRNDCLVPENASFAPGLGVSLRSSKELLAVSPGFYMARGDEDFADDETEGVVRFYLNLTAAGALHFMRRATSLLNLARLPFNLKVLNDRQSYSRCDAVVLYIRKGHYEDAAKILEEIYREISSYLNQRTPAFTKALGPGLGLAEDPGHDQSFGEHRCRLLADGIIRANELGKKSANERFKVVSERFAEDGINLEKPFLNPGSVDNYKFRPRHKRAVTKSRVVSVSSRADASADVFLQTAEAIASRLSREAVWHADRCNWVGAEPVDVSLAGPPQVRYRALGPELYSGTSGVALFLAELHSVTGDAASRRTALGALGQALSRVDTLPSSARLGLFTGKVGIAFAAARVGKVLREEELLERAAKLLRDLTREKQQVEEFDLLSGAAGAIAAFVTLREMLDDKSLMDFAVRLGDSVLQGAHKSDVGYSWGSSPSPRQRNLTGFSHGTAGIAYALLELFHATGESKYRVGVERAFDYERYWFDADAGNWPDFREESGQGRRNSTPFSFSTLWCHGAPGIALSRLRAFQILGDDTYKTEATTALKTTRKTIVSWLKSGTENFSLCHGLAGNAEVLTYGCDVLGQAVAEDRTLIAEVANVGIERHAKRGGWWPCGVGGEETPSLMLGLAGIGYFYLRLHNPKIPAILTLQSESFSQRAR